MGGGRDSPLLVRMLTPVVMHRSLLWPASPGLGECCGPVTTSSLPTSIGSGSDGEWRAIKSSGPSSAAVVGGGGGGEGDGAGSGGGDDPASIDGVFLLTSFLGLSKGSSWRPDEVSCACDISSDVCAFGELRWNIPLFVGFSPVAFRGGLVSLSLSFLRVSVFLPHPLCRVLLIVAKVDGKRENSRLFLPDLDLSRSPSSFLTRTFICVRQFLFFRHTLFCPRQIGISVGSLVIFRPNSHPLHDGLRSPSAHSYFLGNSQFFRFWPC